MQGMSSVICVLQKDTDVVTVTKTKIACTLGPKTREIGIQQELLIAGMQVGMETNYS